MKRFRIPVFATAMLVTIAACSEKKPVDDAANEVVTTPPVASTNPGPAAGGPPATTNESAQSGTVPAALQGRWGLTPADCEPGRSDAKGLLEIGAESLKFYESRATPGTSIEKSTSAISGNWNFTGEGETWSKYISLKIAGNGLVRTERAPVASYTYAKCD